MEIEEDEFETVEKTKIVTTPLKHSMEIYFGLDQQHM